MTWKIVVTTYLARAVKAKYGGVWSIATRQMTVPLVMTLPGESGMEDSFSTSTVWYVLYNKEVQYDMPTAECRYTHGIHHVSIALRSVNEYGLRTVLLKVLKPQGIWCCYRWGPSGTTSPASQVVGGIDRLDPHSILSWDNQEPFTLQRKCKTPLVKDCWRAGPWWQVSLPRATPYPWLTVTEEPRCRSICNYLFCIHAKFYKHISPSYYKPDAQSLKFCWRCSCWIFSQFSIQRFHNL